MADEHLERIEAKLDRVITTQAEHSATLDQHTATLGQHTATLDQHTATLDQHTATLGQHTVALAQHSAMLNEQSQRLEQLDKRTRTVELTLENNVPQAIKQIAEGHAMLQQQMDRGFADMKEHIDARLGPLEEAVRQHSAKLNQVT